MPTKKWEEVKNNLVPRRRGRPKKIVVVEEPDTIQWKVAKKLSDWCGLPGCSPKNHLEEASEIIEIINE